jgi:hypothetical protein
MGFVQNELVNLEFFKNMRTIQNSTGQEENGIQKTGHFLAKYAGRIRRKMFSMFCEMKEH